MSCIKNIVFDKTGTLTLGRPELTDFVAAEGFEEEDVLNILSVNDLSEETYIEISHKNISKKTAIDVVLEHCYPSLSMANVVAFGDNYNDIEMLKAVGLGVAVGNANYDVLKVAKVITDTNINDGVAKAIKQYF